VLLYCREDEQSSRSHRIHPTHAGTRIATAGRCQTPLAFTGGSERPPPLKPTCAQPTPQNGRQAMTGRTSSPGFVETAACKPDSVPSWSCCSRTHGKFSVHQFVWPPARRVRLVVPTFPNANLLLRGLESVGDFAIQQLETVR
jgi:hypothetical protein